MTDTATTEAPAAPDTTVAQKRLDNLAKARAAKAAKPPKPKVAAPKPPKDPNADLEGMTQDDCANECRDGYCVITMMNHCGHPHKGGIQALHQTMPKVKANYHRAKKRLAHLAVDKK
jgi:hypothetical protein